MKFRELIAAAALATTAPTVCAVNLIHNPDFDDGLVDWTAQSTGNGSVLISSVDGSAEAPSARLMVSIDPGQASLRQCIPLVGVAPPWDFGVRVRLVASLGTCQANRIAAEFSDAPCGQPGSVSTVSAIWAGTVAGVQGPFNQFSSTVNSDPMPGGSASQSATLIIELGCFIASAQNINVDKAYFGPVGTTPVGLLSFDVK